MKIYEISKSPLFEISKAEKKRLQAIANQQKFDAAQQERDAENKLKSDKLAQITQMRADVQAQAIADRQAEEESEVEWQLLLRAQHEEDEEERKRRPPYLPDLPGAWAPPFDSLKQARAQAQHSIRNRPAWSKPRTFDRIEIYHVDSGPYQGYHNIHSDNYSGRKGIQYIGGKLKMSVGVDKIEDDAARQAVALKFAEFLEIACHVGDDLYSVTQWDYRDDFVRSTPNPEVAVILDDYKDDPAVAHYLTYKMDRVTPEHMIGAVILNKRNGRFLSYMAGDKVNEFTPSLPRVVVDGIIYQDQVSPLLEISKYGAAYHEILQDVYWRSGTSPESYRYGYKSDFVDDVYSRRDNLAGALCV